MTLSSTSRSRALPVVLATAVAAGLGVGAAALTGRSIPDAAPPQPAGQVQDPSPAPSGTPAGTEPSATPSAGLPSIAFLGDSLTEGIGAPPERGYAWQTAERLGWPIAVVEGVSGSGFLAPGLGRPMTERVDAVVASDPDVVVVAGGTNDAVQGYPAADVGAAAAELLGELRAASPGTTVLVLGPFPTTPEAATAADPAADAVRAAAEAAGADFLDARELVATAVPDPDQWGRYISADGLHPNELGYGLMADALAAELRTLVG